MQQTKKFSEETNERMQQIRSYSCSPSRRTRKEDGSRMSFLEWKVEDDKLQARLANPPGKYDTHSL